MQALHLHEDILDRVDRQRYTLRLKLAFHKLFGTRMRQELFQEIAVQESVGCLRVRVSARR